MDPEKLPLWVEYVKALGTPVIALLAALIAGAIAYRQWVTARNKLKLDFFDRRLEIYSLAVDALEAIRRSETADFSSIQALEDKLHASRWLFNREIQLYLHQLALRVVECIKVRPAQRENMTEEEFAKALASHSHREDIYQKERRALDKRIAPFLSLQH